MSATSIPQVPVPISPKAVQVVPPHHDPRVRALRGRYPDVPAGRRVTALDDELVAVAAKLGRRIMIPERPFTDDEMHTIRILRQLLRTGEIARTWTGLEFSLLPAQVATLLDTFGRGGAGSLLLEAAESDTLELFGTSLPLGFNRVFIRQATLTNERDVRTTLDMRPATTEPIEVRFAPGEDNGLVISYPEWTPSPDATGAARRLDAAERPAVLPPEQSRRLGELFDSGAERPLTAAEQREMDALVEEYGERLYSQRVQLYALQNHSDAAAVRPAIEAAFIEALAWWERFEADPGSEEVIAAWVRRRKGEVDG